MKLAVMQPYLFPYIGYFQLIFESDLFLIYDDVTFIKQGYINRNRILSPNGPTRFTVPVPGASSNKLISDLEFSDNTTKVLKTIEQSYSKAPFFTHIFPLIHDTLKYRDRSISSVCLQSYQTILSYLNIERSFNKTSELDYNRSLSAQNRLISLCHHFDASCYINTTGGINLYSKEDFIQKGITLNFISPLPIKYKQGVSNFTPNLSIIDILMNCPKEDVIKIIRSYKIKN